MKRHIAAAALGCTTFFAAPLTANAAIDFNNLHLNYIQSDAENTDGDGFGATLSFEVTDSLFVNTAYSTRTYDENTPLGRVSLDSELFHFGLGGIFALNESGTLKAYVMALYEETKFSGSFSGNGGNTGGTDGGNTGEPAECNVLGVPVVDDLLCALGADRPSSPQTKAFVLGNDEDSIDGYGLTGGIRFEVMPNWEINGSYGARDYSDLDEMIYIYNFGTAFSFGSWTLFANYDIRDYDGDSVDEILAGVRWDFSKE